jgi:hypothetical protein
MGHHDPPEIRIAELAVEPMGSGSRVSARVDGAPLWFESDDVPLRLAPEAFGSATLLPAAQRRAAIAIDAPVDEQWLANVRRLLEIARDWWGTPAHAPNAAVASGAPAAAATRIGLCFSGGVDSFHSLLRSGHRVERLVLVHGFDVELADTPRMAAAAASVREVADASDARAIVVRTNLREHPLYGEISWERAHGGALAAIGHLLDAEIGRLIISSSVSLTGRRQHWGSHWTLDALWSSRRLQILHCGEAFNRLEKLEQIGVEPVVQRHLRVCWENLAPTGNCSRCSKCLRTMALLASLGLLDRYPGFGGEPALIVGLERMPSLPEGTRSFERASLSLRLSPELRAAMLGLLDRTRRRASVPRRIARLARSLATPRPRRTR